MPRRRPSKAAVNRIQAKLEQSIGLGRVEDIINDAIKESAEIVVADFERVLGELRKDSVSGALEGYVVKTEEKMVDVTVGRSGRVLSLIQFTIYVKSPYKKLNVFDILDVGRPALPARGKGKSPYPLWSVRGTTLTSTSSRRNIKTGRFSLSQATKFSGGVRPEKQRFKLKGKYKKSGLRPLLFTRKALRAVPARNLYDRILTQSIKKMRTRGFDTFGLVKVKRDG